LPIVIFSFLIPTYPVVIPHSDVPFFRKNGNLLKAASDPEA